MQSFNRFIMLLILATVYLCSYDISGICAVRTNDAANLQDARNLSLVQHFGAGACYQVVVYDSVAYFGRGSILEIYDIRDPYNPVHLASNPLGYNIYGLFFDGRYMYVAAGSRGFQIVDLFTKDSPVQLGSYEPANRRTVGVRQKATMPTQSRNMRASGFSISRTGAIRRKRLFIIRAATFRKSLLKMIMPISPAGRWVSGLSR